MFPNFWDGVWQALATATTVGYGDLYPTDVGGRIIGIVFIQTETLRRIEADVAELKTRIPAS